MINKKFRRKFIQVFPFGVTWLVFAIVYGLLENGIIGDLDYYPATGNIYSFKASVLYTGIGSFFMGLLQGWIEVTWLRKLFAPKALWFKIVIKSLFYLSFIILFLAMVSVAATSLILEISLTDPVVLRSLRQFLFSFSFWSIVIYIGLTLNVAMVFYEITEYFGQDTFYNFLLGKYHKPNLETRIFMFLDMKSSTAIAEKLGHEKYFELIKKYYSDMTQPILDTSGDIYQYVGDEIVISWLEKKGVKHNNCVECLRKISESIEKQKEQYYELFGLVPEFKAGFHVGEVTSGEIGIIKKDIIYTGDVLNTTARIQGECNKYNAQALISEELFRKLPLNNGIEGIAIGTLQLRGKTAPTKLYSLSF